MYFVFFYLFMVGQPVSEFFPFLVGHCCSINENTNKNFLLKKNHQQTEEMIRMWFST